MRKTHHIRRHEALDQVSKEAWQCASCTMPALEDEPHCLSCKLYWQDVMMGRIDP